MNQRMGVFGHNHVDLFFGKSKLGMKGQVIS